MQRLYRYIKKCEKKLRDCLLVFRKKRYTATMREIVRDEVQAEVLQSIYAYSRLIPQPFLSQFEVHIVDHCNLRCRSCSNFSSIAEECFADISVFERDMERMAHLTAGEVGTIFLLGGEPLLHPQLLEFCLLARKYFSSAKIEVVTNGVLLGKMDEKFWRQCKLHNITVAYSPYPGLGRELPKKAEELGAVSRMPGRQVEFFWRLPLDLKGEQNAAASFLGCHQANHCVSLRQGRLYTCAVIPNIHSFNNRFDANLRVSGRDFIDIHSAASLEEILSFLAKPTPFCRYCAVRERSYDLPWSQGDRQISEWLPSRSQSARSESAGGERS